MAGGNETVAPTGFPRSGLPGKMTLDGLSMFALGPGPTSRLAGDIPQTGFTTVTRDVCATVGTAFSIPPNTAERDFTRDLVDSWLTIGDVINGPAGGLRVGAVGVAGTPNLVGLCERAVAARE